MTDSGALRQEQLMRKVAPIGNGAHIFAPKEWIGEEIMLIRSIPSFKEKVMAVLEPYLTEIAGAYVFGSYARGEEQKDSDIDVLVIANRELHIRSPGFEIIALRKEDLKKAFRLAPILLYSALAEAKSIINSQLLEELRREHRAKKEDFKEYIRETTEIIALNEQLLDTYSIMLRLRGVYAIQQLLAGRTYSYAGLKSWLNSKTNIDINSLYIDYRNAKSGLKISHQEEKLKELVSFLKKELMRMG